MEITQTIRLSDDERKTLSEALEIIDKISDTANCSMSEVFTYLVSCSTFNGVNINGVNNGFNVDEIVQIADLR